MAFSKEFERELNRLFRLRTHWLRSELGAKGAGKPPQFGRKKVDKGIERLQLLASGALALKLAKAENQRMGTPRQKAAIRPLV